MENTASEFISATEKLKTGQERLTAYLIDNASKDIALSGLKVVLQLQTENARPASYYDLENHTTGVVEGELAEAIKGQDIDIDHEMHTSEAALSQRVRDFIAPHVGTVVNCHIPDKMVRHIPAIASELGVPTPPNSKEAWRPGTYI